MDSRTDDILAQAEVLLKNQPKWRILASEDAEDVKSLIELMPQLLAEAKRQKALNPFQVDVSTAMRLGDNEFVYGDKKSLDLCENRIRDRDAWKAKAIGERAKAALVDDDMTCSDYDECIKELIAEVERLRSDQDAIMAAWDKDAVEKDARVQELEADRIEARAQYLLFLNDNPGCIAWNFDELDETEQDALRELARYTLELEEPWAYIQLREAREQIKRLEAAFLDHLAARLYYEHYPGVSDAYSWHDYPEDACHSMPKEEFRKKAREALEEIKNGMEN